MTDILDQLRQWNDPSWPTVTTTVPEAFDRQARLTRTRWRWSR